MLAPGQTMPDVLGAGAPKINAGTLRTRGWELSIDWRHHFNEVNVYANASIGDFKTVITKLDNDSQLLIYGDLRPIDILQKTILTLTVLIKKGLLLRKN